MTSISILVGGYSGVVSTLTFDTQTHTLTKQWESVKSEFGDAPTWITPDLSGRYVFITDETNSFGGVDGQGEVLSAAVNNNASLSFVSRSITKGGPVNCALSHDEKSLLVADYTAGCVEAFAVTSESNASPAILSEETSQVHCFTGSGPDPVRQTKPYAHQVIFDPFGHYSAVCDLGTDRVHFFTSPSRGLEEQGALVLPPGSGPRHVAYIVHHHHQNHQNQRQPNLTTTSTSSSPSSSTSSSSSFSSSSSHSSYHSSTTFGYIICELSNEIFVTSAPSPLLPASKIIQSISTLPTNANKSLPFGAGEVIISPNGHYVFASNRLPTPDVGGEDDNTIAIYHRHPVHGHLTTIGFVPCGGRHPRSMTFDSTGKWLFVAAQLSNKVIVHHWDSSTRSLSIVATIEVDTPAVVTILPTKQIV